MRHVIAVLLVFWEPVRFASEALNVLPTLSYRGWAAGAELALHGAVAALCAAGGLMLWNAGPDARKVASAAVIAAAGRAVQSTFWTALPNNTAPGDEILVSAVAILIGGVALVLIRRVS